MAVLVPFRALRPTPASAVRVAAVPYDVVSAGEAKMLAEGNPLSFLHVSRPEIDLPAGTNPHSDEVYAKAVENFTTLKQRAPLVLYHFEEMPYQEIAQHLQISLSKVKTDILRGRAALAKILARVDGIAEVQEH